MTDKFVVKLWDDVYKVPLFKRLINNQSSHDLQNFFIYLVHQFTTEVQCGHNLRLESVRGSQNTKEPLMFL